MPETPDSESNNPEASFEWAKSLGEVSEDTSVPHLELSQRLMDDEDRQGLAAARDEAEKLESRADRESALVKLVGAYTDQGWLADADEIAAEIHDPFKRTVAIVRSASPGPDAPTLSDERRKEKLQSAHQEAERLADKNERYRAYRLLILSGDKAAVKPAIELIEDKFYHSSLNIGKVPRNVSSPSVGFELLELHDSTGADTFEATEEVYKKIRKWGQKRSSRVPDNDLIVAVEMAKRGHEGPLNDYTADNRMPSDAQGIDDLFAPLEAAAYYVSQGDKQHAQQYIRWLEGGTKNVQQGILRGSLKGRFGDRGQEYEQTVPRALDRALDLLEQANFQPNVKPHSYVAEEFGLDKIMRDQGGERKLWLFYYSAVLYPPRS